MAERLNTVPKDKFPLKVTINGTNSNPYMLMGLTANPFPQIAKAELMLAMAQLGRLAAEPILNVSHIRIILKGWSDEFVELCVSQFKPGHVTTFTVYLDKEWIS